MKDVELTYGKPATLPVLSAWEQVKNCNSENFKIMPWFCQTQGCVLPEDVKEFYLSNDGVRLKWNYQYNGIDFV